MTEHKSENLEIKVTKEPNCLVKLDIKALPSLVIEARKKAIKEVNKECSIPGFRRGKAPETTILKQHPQAVEAAWQKAIADLSYIEAQNLIKIYPLNSSTKINYNLKKHSLEEGAELTFSFETEPEVPTVDPALFKLKPTNVPPVDDLKINEAIRQAQFYFAKWEEVDRPIKEGDFVILDLDSIEKEPTRVFSSTRFEIKDKLVAKWMKDLLIGAKKGDVLEGISKPDDDISEEEKAKFSPKKVRITIQHIEEAQLPELNDDFAKKIGANNPSDLKEKIKDMLEKQKKDAEDKEKKEQVNRFLLENYHFDLPLSLYKSESKYRKDQMLQDHKFKLSWDKMTSEEKKTFEANLDKGAKEAVSLYYLSRKIVADAKIEPNQNEIHSEILKTIQERTPLGEEPNLKHVTEELYALCFSKILMEKAQSYILNHS